MSNRMGPLRGLRSMLGHHIAPPRFVLFVSVMLATAAWRHWMGGHPWGDSLVIGFDLGVIAFVLSLWPLTKDHGAEQMHLHAVQNDANRAIVLIITGCSVLAIMTAINAELPAAHHGDMRAAMTG